MSEDTAEGDGVEDEAADNVRIVRKFLNALRDQEFDTGGALLDDNLVYQNVGLPTIHGGRRTITLFRKAKDIMGFDVKIHRIAVDGSAVLTERTDALIFGPLRLQFWVCGTFEVHRGRITLWRDYFDMFDTLKAAMRGLVGAIIPAHRPKF